MIAPPSAHRSGEWYEWLRGPDRSLPEMPPWLLDLLDPPRPSMPVRRAVTRGSRYAETVFDAEVSIVQDAPVGTRNDTLNRAAFNIGTLVGASASRSRHPSGRPVDRSRPLSPSLLWRNRN